MSNIFSEFHSIYPYQKCQWGLLSFIYHAKKGSTKKLFFYKQSKECSLRK